MKARRSFMKASLGWLWNRFHSSGCCGNASMLPMTGVRPAFRALPVCGEPARWRRSGGFLRRYAWRGLGGWPGVALARPVQSGRRCPASGFQSDSGVLVTLRVDDAVQRSAPLHLATLCRLRCRALPGFAVKQCRGSFGAAAQVPRRGARGRAGKRLRRVLGDAAQTHLMAAYCALGEFG